MNINIEKLKQELEQKYKELDEYIETYKDYLSNEADNIRKEIYRLQDKIKLLEKAKNASGYMRNKETNDKEVANESVIALKFALMQQQIDEKDKKIQELEEENKTLREYIFKAPNLDEMTAVRYASMQQEAYIRGKAEEQQRAEQIIHENYILKQKAKDVLQNNRNELFSTVYLSKKQYEMQIERINKIEQELLEGEK